MTPKPHFLLKVLAVCCISALYVFPSEGRDIGFNCRCLRPINAFINPRQIKYLEIIPRGAHCRQLEILITLRTNRTICVDVNAKWIRKVIKRVMLKEAEQEVRADRNATTDAP